MRSGMITFVYYEVAILYDVLPRVMIESDGSATYFE